MRAFRNTLIAFIAIAGFIIVIAAASYLTNWLGAQPQRIGLTTPLAITAVPPLPGTPIARFYGLDPGIASVLAAEPGLYGVPALEVLSIQPVGAYLPASGSTQFDLIPPTALPTPLPYPTSPPLPLPTLPDQPLPTPERPDAVSTSSSQPYGGRACAPSGRPVEGVLSQRFHAYHLGVDVAVPTGTAVRATHSGTVIYAGWSDIGYGYLVIIQNENFITYYAHNTSFNVSLSQQVGKGSIIAWSGSTGNSSGPHVHYETRINDIPVDPNGFEARGYPTC